MNQNRIQYLDGIRGMAALIVVFYHYLLSFYPGIFPFNPKYQYSTNNLGKTMEITPLNIFLNPGFAVCLFFVVSGYALSYKYFATGEREYLRASVIRRYFRLEIPILFSVLVSYILLKADLYANIDIGNNYSKNTFWLVHLWNIDANFFAALKEALYSSLFIGGTPNFNPVLWTMVIEFMGSMLVFAVLALFGNSAKRFLVYAILLMILHTNCMPAFILGLALCDYYHSEKRKVFPKIAVFLIFIAALYIGSYQGLEIASIWGIVDFMSHADKSFPFIIGAALFVFAVINSEWLKRFFSSPVLQFLGKISFSLYLLHLLIIGSLACYLFGYFFTGLHLSYDVSFMLMFFISLSFTFGAAFLMYKYVDLNGIKLSKWIYQKFFTEKINGEGK
jgi:peptidoglycan/LPS O-acetylase OafA/YrhL